MPKPVQVFEGHGEVWPPQIVVDLWQLNDEFFITNERVQVFKEDYDFLPLNPDQKIRTNEDMVSCDAWSVTNKFHMTLVSACRLPDGSIGCDKFGKVLPVIDYLRPGPECG